MGPCFTLLAKTQLNGSCNYDAWLKDFLKWIDRQDVSSSLYSKSLMIAPTDDSVKSNYELLLDEQSRKLQSTINRALCRVLKISIDTTKVNPMTITAPGKK